MKRLLIMLLTLMMVFPVFAEGGQETSRQKSSDTTMTQATEKAMHEANAQTGFPSIINFKEKKDLKMLYELRDQSDLICYAYIVAGYTGKLVFLGKCIGYGLPYSVQFSNPEKVLVERNSSTAGDIPYTVPQPEPNGLFMPEGLSATWLMMLDGDTVKPVYVEPEIIVSPFKLH